MKTKRLTMLAFFTTIALIIFTVESAIPPLVPIPGIKLGLANIITLVLIQRFTAKDALCVLIMRIFLSTFFFGQALSLLYSLAGGLLCFACMYLVNCLLQGHLLFLTSIMGAVFHNLGQLAIAYLLTGTSGVLVYAPFLFFSGILTGLFTGLCAYFALKRLRLPEAAALYGPKGDGGNSEQAP